MINELGGGPLLPPVVTGVTVETETEVLLFGATSAGPTLLAPAYVTTTVAVLVPSFSALGSYVTVSVIPAGPIVPDDGVTVAHGLSVVAVKLTAGVLPAMKTLCATPFAPTAIDVRWPGASGRTT